MKKPLLGKGGVILLIILLLGISILTLFSTRKNLQTHIHSLWKYSPKKYNNWQSPEFDDARWEIVQFPFEILDSDVGYFRGYVEIYDKETALFFEKEGCIEELHLDGASISFEVHCEDFDVTGIRPGKVLIAFKVTNFFTKIKINIKEKNTN